MIDLSSIPVPLLVQLLTLFAVTLGCSLTARFTLAYSRSRNRSSPWINVCAETVLLPLQWLIWGFSFLLMARLVLSEVRPEMSLKLLTMGQQLLFVIAATWSLLRCRHSVEQLLLKRVEINQGDKALIYALSRLFTVCVSTVSILTVLSTVGVEISALLAVGGIGAFAVSWAGKDVVANFFGGLMIYIKRPFTVNDWIMSPNKGFEGTVEDIGWYMTRIRTFERRPMFIPNASLLDAIIENPGRMYNRRIKCDLGLRYCDVDHVSSICQKIENMLHNHPEIDQNQTLMVHFLAFNNYSLDVQVYCFTKTTSWAKYREVQQDVLLKMANIVHEQGADFAYPTQTLFVEPDGSEKSTLDRLSPSNV